MKRILFGTALAAVCLAASCQEQLNRLLTFRITSDASCTVPGTNPLGPVFNNLVSTPAVPTNSSQTFQNEGTNANLVKDIRLEKLTLSVNTPADADFRFIQSVKIYIRAEGLPKILIASRTDIPETIGRTLDLSPTDARLDEYIKKPEYTLENEVVTRKAPWPEMRLNVATTFKVTADPL